MKRVILRMPASFTPASLTPEQAAAIANVLGQWVQPMPGTQAHEGDQLVDGVASDAFNPDNMALLGLPFTVVGLWQWSGYAGDALTVLQALDEATLLAHLPPTPVLDGEGNVTGSTPAVLHEPHRWAGWPAAL